MYRKGTSFVFQNFNMLKKLFFFWLMPTYLYSQQTTTLETVMIEESRMQMPFSKNVRNIQLITKEDIAHLPARTLNEVLSYAAGVDLRQRGPFGTQADISIDGGSFEQTLILLNGVKISDPQTGHHSMNIPVPLDAIERIEILKGPAARIYGINALTGAINIVTKTPTSNNVLVNVYGGSSFKQKEENDGSGIYGGWGAQVTAQIAKNKSSHLITGSRDDYNGQRYNSSFENNKVFYQGRVQLNDKNRLELLGGYTSNHFGANGFYASPIDRESFEIVKTSIFSISSHHQLNDKIKFTARISDRYNEDDYRFYRHDLNTARSQHYNNVLAGEIHGSLQTNIGTFGVGIETRFESINSSNIGSHTRNNQGVYAEYKTSFDEKLLMNIGTYINYNSQFGWQVFPGIDMSYFIHSNWKLGLNIGSSQRIPTYTDLYLNQGAANIGNPNLKSENAINYEMNIRRQVRRSNFQVGYFYRNISSFIDWIREMSSQPYQPFNLGDFKVHGFNIQYGYRNEYTPGKMFAYKVSYNYLSPQELVFPAGFNSKYKIESLKHQLIGLLKHSSMHWDFSINNRFIKREIGEGYYIMDLRASYKFKEISLYTDIMNLFDQTYIETAAVPMPGRWFTVGFMKRF